MPLPEGYLPREGDILTFRAQVRHNVTPGEDHVHVTKPGTTYSNLVLDLKDVEGLYCRHWEVGEEVWIRHDKKNQATVIGVDEDRVWVKFSTAGGYATYSANDLTEVVPDVGPKDFGLPETEPPRAPDAVGDDEMPI